MTAPKTPTVQQKYDAAFLVRQRWACLFSEPGTGKTLTAITARKALPDDLRTLVIAPRIALTQWQKELAEQGIEATVLRSTKDYKALKAATVVVTTWALMALNTAKLDAWEPVVIIADESHACIDWKAKRTKAFFGGRDTEGLATGAEWCWMLTGTPVVRFADDLWPMMAAMFKDHLRAAAGDLRRKVFCNRFVQYRNQRIAGGRSVPVAFAGKNEDQLFDVIYDDANPMAVRRTLAEVDAELPELRERDIDVDLTGLDDSAMATMTDEELMSNSPEAKSLRRAFGIAKIDSSAEYLRSIEGPTLVLAWHQDVIDGLAGALSDQGVAVIRGGTNQKHREEALEKFAAGKVKFLIGQIGAVGTALDGLQHACHRAVFAERIGSPALMGQAIARVQRRGQRHTVTVETLRADHRLERVTDTSLAAKTETQAKAIG